MGGSHWCGRNVRSHERAAIQPSPPFRIRPMSPATPTPTWTFPDQHPTMLTLGSMPCITPAMRRRRVNRYERSSPTRNIHQVRAGGPAGHGHQACGQHGQQYLCRRCWSASTRGDLELTVGHTYAWYDKTPFVAPQPMMPRKLFSTVAMERRSMPRAALGNGPLAMLPMNGMEIMTLPTDQTIRLLVP